MAPRRTRVLSTEPAIETDRLEGFAHPRENFSLVGQDDALGRAARAIRSGRTPQAWLITGPPGIGKATMAYRIARYLLAYGATDRGPADLSVTPTAEAAVQLSAGSHPGLLAIRRGLHPSTGRPMTVVSVDEVRRLQNFFGLTSTSGGWRVAIVDTADDMNENAANALLKMLEEPPKRAMLLLLSNTPGRLLPTIRSRCQRLVLDPLDDKAIDQELARLAPDLSAKDRAAVVRLSGGSLGLSLRLAGNDGVMLANEANRLIDNAATADVTAVLGLAERVTRAAGGMDQFGDFLVQALSTRIHARAQTGAPHLDRWVDCVAQLNESFLRTKLLYLEPRQTLLSGLRRIARAARNGKV